MSDDGDKKKVICLHKDVKGQVGDIYEKNDDGIPFSCSLRERVSVEMGDF